MWPNTAAMRPENGSNRVEEEERKVPSRAHRGGAVQLHETTRVGELERETRD
jgi:hypothetical protein